MMVAYIFLTVFAVAINLGLFNPTLLDDLTINLNLNESPKGYEEDAFNNNDYQAPEFYTPTITNNYDQFLDCSISLKNNKILQTGALQPDEKWNAGGKWNAVGYRTAIADILCIYAYGSPIPCDRFSTQGGTTNPNWVVIPSGGQNPCKVEMEPTPYKPTILNSYNKELFCHVTLQSGYTLLSTAIPPRKKWMSPEPVNRLTTHVLCQFAGGSVECDPLDDMYGTTNPDWMVSPSGGQSRCKVEKAPILYIPSITNLYERRVTCTITLNSGKILSSPALELNQRWASPAPVNEETRTVSCEPQGRPCEQYGDDRGTKNADWLVTKSTIGFECKVKKFVAP